MVQNMQEVWQSDFLGGVNDRLQADALPDNQCSTILNMLPSKRGRGLEVRGGFTVSAAQPADSIDRALGSFAKVLTTGETVTIFAVAAGIVGSERIDIKMVRRFGSADTVVNIESSAITYGGSRTFASAVDGVWFCDWDGDRFFFSDGYSGLYTVNVNTSNFSATAAARVLNKNGIANLNANAPHGRGLIQHKGRLWLYRGGEVFFCGTDDTQAHERWENWYPYDGTDPQQTNIDDGGSMVVMPFGSPITGLVSGYNGLVVLKERSISVWSYPDSAAPWEVAEGASIEEIERNIGCMSPDTIATSGSLTFFIGRNNANEYTLFSLDGTAVTDVGTDVPERMQGLSATSRLYCEVLGDNYYVFADDGCTMVFNIANGSWFDADTPLGVVPIAVDNKMRVIGNGGYMFEYPSGTTDGGAPIEWSITTREFRPKGEFGEFKTRQVFLEVGSAGAEKVFHAVSYNGVAPPRTVATKYDSGANYDSGVTYLVRLDTYGQSFDLEPRSVAYNSGAVYNDPSTLYGGAVGLYRMRKSTINERARFITLEVRGASYSELFVTKVGLGFRGRTGKL